MRRNLVMMLLTLGLTACPPPASGPPVPRLEVQGHRGCRGLRPENTLAAFRHAIALGVDVLELDLGLTADRVLAVAHDPEVNDTLCRASAPLPARRLRDLTFEQVRTLDCGALKNPRFPNQVLVPGARIPRLEQVLALLREHPRLGLNIEIKTFPDRPQVSHPPAEFARALAPLLAAPGLAARVVVQSFDPRALQAMAAAAPRVTLAALADRRADMEPMLQATGARIISPRFSELMRGDIATFHKRGVRVVPWTVNQVADMKRLMARGVDGIITDYPDRLLPLR